MYKLTALLLLSTCMAAQSKHVASKAADPVESMLGPAWHQQKCVVGDVELPHKSPRILCGIAQAAYDRGFSNGKAYALIAQDGPPYLEKGKPITITPGTNGAGAGDMFAAPLLGIRPGHNYDEESIQYHPVPPCDGLPQCVASIPPPSVKQAEPPVLTLRESPDHIGIITYVGPPTMTADGLRIDRMSDDEYTKLKAARKALADVEHGILEAHGVQFASGGSPCSAPINNMVACDAIYIPYIPADTVEWKGQFLLIQHAGFSRQ